MNSAQSLKPKIIGAQNQVRTIFTVFVKLAKFSLLVQPVQCL